MKGFHHQITAVRATANGLQGRRNEFDDGVTFLASLKECTRLHVIYGEHYIRGQNLSNTFNNFIEKVWPRVILFFMLNTTEFEIYPAQKYYNVNNC